MNNYEQAPRLLCVFAHPDDEVFCAGGTIAKYVNAGAEVMVVSATKGDAGQIRDANLATRRTLGKVREQELRESCNRLGAQHAVCLNYGDGTLKDLDLNILVEHIVKIIRQFCPDIVITFGPDGGYGHPDHVAVSNATTIACSQAGHGHQFATHLSDGLEPHAPEALYHAYFPHRPILMIDSLSKWLIDTDHRTNLTDVNSTTEFVRALLLFAEETTLLHYSSDRMDVNWYPSGFYIIEQGEHAKDLYLILSGTAEAYLEREDGSLELLAEMGVGQFFGERGIAHKQMRAAHVVAKDNVTCLVLSNAEAINFGGRGSHAHIQGGALVIHQNHDATSITEAAEYSHCIDVMDYVYTKISAMSAHRTQYPITPDMFPLHILQELMGYEYFVRILPRPVVATELFSHHNEFINNAYLA
jgi:LmbE family N-acetylglucosaminyl deacetylase